MRVAYVCADPGVPAFGCKGCSVHVQAVLREFIRRGFSVDLFAVSPGGEPPSDLAVVRVHVIPASKAQSGEARECALAAVNQSVTSMLAAEGPFDLIYERHALFAHAAMEFAAESGAAGVLEVNAPLIDEQIKFRELVRRSDALDAAQRAAAAARCVVAVSVDAANYARELRGRQAGVHVVPNGVDPQRFASHASQHENHDRFTIGFLGTLKPWHGAALLVEAVARLRHRVADARLLIIGDGPLRKTLEMMGSSLCGADAVEFTGAVDPADVPAHLARCSVAAAPYPVADGFYFSPLKVLEYMAAGLPIVASRVGQIAEMIDHGRTGLLVPPGDVPALVSALAQVHAHPSGAHRLGAAARAVAVERFSWRGVVDRILSLADVDPLESRLESSPARRTA